ncbi:MAG TPA: acyltransferase family protein [Acidimicrobiales bacterium]|nr:acyltransferase family protein [Acidimicrobiales bacterium]
MPRPVEGTSPYLPGLDGIRAVAVLAVIAYHLNFGWVPGGLLGVQVFFVLSGYLITDLLVAEYRRHQGIGLKIFWIRRARRLLPALFVVLFVAVGWATLFDRLQLSSLRSDLPSSVFYVSNWWFVFHHVSYFAKFGPPSPLGHLWSLSIEEQFYLVWPLLVLAGMRWIRSTGALIGITLAVAAGSAVEMALLYAASPNGDPTRVYDGTDTRAFALLIGAALAFGLPRNRTFGPITAGATRVLNLVGAAALAGIFVMFWHTNQYDPFLYQGGMVLLAVLTALVIGVTVHPGSQWRVILGWEPLRWVGERSYGIYLWHYPVIVMTTPLNAQPSLVRSTFQISVTLALAALSWRYVEQPVRHGALGRQWERLRRHDWSWPRLRPLGWLMVAVASVNAVVCALGLFGLVEASAANLGPEASIVPRVRHHPPPAATVPPGGGSTTTTAAPPAGQGVTAIGDSVIVDAAPYLQAALPGIVIDAQVGQQLYLVQGMVGQLKADGFVGNRLILELGTNGPYTAGQLETLLNSLGPMQRIVLVNTHVPGQLWQQEVNDTIASVAQSYPNTVLVDWNAASAGCPQCLYPDGTHLNPVGARYYASLLVSALEAPSPSAAHQPPTSPATPTTTTPTTTTKATTTTPTAPTTVTSTPGPHFPPRHR